MNMNGWLTLWLTFQNQSFHVLIEVNKFHKLADDHSILQSNYGNADGT